MWVMFWLTWSIYVLVASVGVGGYESAGLAACAWVCGYWMRDARAKAEEATP